MLLVVALPRVPPMTTVPHSDPRGFAIPALSLSRPRATKAADAARLRAAVEKRTGLTDQRLLAAIECTPRELFVPEEQRQHAYEDVALPIGLEQTISQPSMVALMLAELQCSPQHELLEVGTGSGYAAAVVSNLVSRVYGVERHAELAYRSRAVLARLGLTNVTIEHGDGTRIGAERRFDRILVSAAATAVPSQLVAALAPGGRLVMPVGTSDRQTLLRVELGHDGILREQLGVPCIFVPLVEGQ